MNGVYNNICLITLSTHQSCGPYNSPSVSVSCSTFWWGCCLHAFCFKSLLLGSFTHASFGDKDVGPAFLREHGHLNTMGKQCCALNGLPRFVNEDEQINK